MNASKSSSNAIKSGQETEPNQTSATDQISASVADMNATEDYSVAFGYSRKPLNGRFDDLVGLYPMLSTPVVQQREGRFESWIYDERAVAFRKLRDDDDEKSVDSNALRVHLGEEEDVFWYHCDIDSGTRERMGGSDGRQIECGYQCIKNHDYDVHPALQSGVNATEGVYEDLLDRHILLYRVRAAVETNKRHIVVYQVNVRTGFQTLLQRSPPETTPVKIPSVFDARLEPFPESPMSAMALSSATFEFQIFVADEKRLGSSNIIVLAGSTLNGQTWEDSVFPLNLEALDDAVIELILSDTGKQTLFALEPRAGDHGDHNSVVVLTNEDMRRQLRRVEMNESQYVNDPLLEPWENDCKSQSRIIEYAEILCKGGLCILSAATATRCYFGQAFDRMFRSYKHFGDSLESTLGKRLKYVVTDENELCRVAGGLMAQTDITTGDDRIYYYVLGGDRPGGFENIRGETYVMDYAREYTRIHEGALVLTGFPWDSLLRIFQHGQFRKFRMCELPEATWLFCRLQIRTVMNGWEVMGVNRFLDGRVSYCVRHHGDAQLQVKSIADLRYPSPQLAGPSFVV